MAFRINSSQQLHLNDGLTKLSARQLRFLEKSFAKPFGDTIFPMIDESRFAPLYCADNGRPNTPVNIMIGAELLREMLGLTDDELLESIMLDPRFHYALRLTSFEEIPFSDRTLSRFRERLYLHELLEGEDLLKDEIERLGAAFADLLKIDGRLKRMDSVMVSSSCKSMGRLELMYTCISNLVRALVAAEEAQMLPAHFLEYAKENRNSVCYRLDKEEVQSRLEQVAADALLLYELAAYALNGEVEFQLLERMLKDQTRDGKLKPKNEIRSDSLQNPSDEEATFRRKAGKIHRGYVGNIVEDCGEDANIITRYDFDVNTTSDIELGISAIEAMGKQKERTIAIVDGAFVSEETIALAEANNIELVPTSLTGKAPLPIITGFVVSEESILSCPAGHAPDTCTYVEDTETYRAHFDKDKCTACQWLQECPAKLQRKRAVVQLTKTTINRAMLILRMGTDEYKQHARKRNGVEGMPSVLRRRYRVDEMPVRGLLRTKLRFGFMVGAINAKRVIAAYRISSFFTAFERVSSRFRSLGHSIAFLPLQVATFFA